MRGLIEKIITVFIFVVMFAFGWILTAPAQVHETMPTLDEAKIVLEEGMRCSKGAGVMRSYEPDDQTGLYYRETKIRSKTYFIGSHEKGGRFVFGWFSRVGDGVVTETGDREYFQTKYPSFCALFDNVFDQKDL